ncbi:type VI secretion system accessory protein TagJ [Rouxiella sp. Mn2063]|uniref:type VI secretion system accessory protein TagJ n=1 Tax=Rouxiella sp. Mn2063 TaxID=3395262 RepID=UPI003BDE3FE8
MFDSFTLNDLSEKKSFNEILSGILAQVKTKPSDSVLRELLFKLYCIDGLWDKALLQLDIMKLLDDSLKKRAELYKNLTFSELLRNDVLSGKNKAGALDIQFPEWVETLHQANVSFGKNDLDNSNALRDRAFELAPESTGNGTITGDFSWISDSDGRVGPICEFISAGGYRWVPFSMIQSFEVPKPKNLLDLIWAPAQLKIENNIYYGFIPSRYPVATNSEQNIKLGLVTEWNEVSAGFSVANGRKTFITDNGDYSLLELDQVTIF